MKSYLPFTDCNVKELVIGSNAESANEDIILNKIPAYFGNEYEEIFATDIGN